MSAEQNKAIVRYVLETTWSGNLDVLNEHPGMHDSIPYLTELHHSVDFISREIVQQLADGDWVVTRFLSSGVNNRPFMGMPAGTKSHMETITMGRLQDGVIVEWHGHTGPYQQSA